MHTQYYHTVPPHSTITQYYHTVLPHSTTTHSTTMQYYHTVLQHTVLPHSTTTLCTLPYISLHPMPDFSQMWESIHLQYRMSILNLPTTGIWAFLYIISKHAKFWGGIKSILFFFFLFLIFGKEG